MCLCSQSAVEIRGRSDLQGRPTRCIQDRVAAAWSVWVLIKRLPSSLQSDSISILKQHRETCGCWQPRCHYWVGNTPNAPFRSYSRSPMVQTQVRTDRQDVYLRDTFLPVESRRHTWRWWAVCPGSGVTRGLFGWYFILVQLPIYWFNPVTSVG